VAAVAGVLQELWQAPDRTAILSVDAPVFAP